MSLGPFFLFSRGTFTTTSWAEGFDLFCDKPSWHTLVLVLVFIRHTKSPQTTLWKPCPHRDSYLFIPKSFLCMILPKDIISTHIQFTVLCPRRCAAWSKEQGLHLLCSRLGFSQRFVNRCELIREQNWEYEEWRCNEPGLKCEQNWMEKSNTNWNKIWTRLVVKLSKT